MEVCMKCSRKCFLRKNCSESPPISSFFKVMFGNKFSERLFLPPKFVRTHKLDVGRKMILKDSSGRRWCVVLSCIDGGLAFDKGWHEFSITHGIEEGDFVVFHYVVESSQFIVQIFGRSACEKQVFSVDNKKKRKTSIDEGYTFSKNKESYPSAKEHASVPENSPDTEIAPSPSMAQKPVVKSLKSEILAPSGSLDREPIPSVPELGEVVPAIEDPSLSLLKEHGTRSRTRTPTPTPCPMPTTQSSKKAGRPRGRPTVVKQEPRVVKQERRIVLKEEVLIEEPEPLDIIFATVSSITCSVQANKDYFLLSEPLPLKPGRLVKREKKVVYLDDPVGRTWPVLYHQSHDSNVLASGWDVFRKANDIQTDNTCTFSLADVDEPIFAVTIHSLLYLN